MAATYYPRRGTAGNASASQILLITTISAEELETTQDEVPGKEPHLLTLVKRLVHTLDLLEVSDNGAWVTAIGSLTDAGHVALFQPSALDRLRARYAMYGRERSILLELHDALEAVIP
jgi:hypothetical protein